MGASFIRSRVALAGLCLSLAVTVRTHADALPDELGPPALTVARLKLDPHGADFGPWIERFRVEIYKSWAAAAAGLGPSDRGRVLVEFTVDRGGGLTRVRAKRVTGPKVLAGVVEKALRASTFLRLPSGFTERAATLEGTFVVGDQP